MQDINVVAIAGRLTADSDLHTFDNGGGVLNFSIASNRSVKKGDKFEDEPSFINVKYFSKGASRFSEYLKKGTQVLVEGQFVQERWTNKEGNNSSTICIYAKNVQLCGSRKTGESSNEVSSNENPSFDDMDETIPF